MFGMAHIAKISKTLANFDEEKPVSALILATQVVSKFLHQVQSNIDLWRSNMFLSNGPPNKVAGPFDLFCCFATLKSGPRD